jgi:hypothetical protein
MSEGASRDVTHPQIFPTIFILIAYRLQPSCVSPRMMRPPKESF